MKGRNCHFPNLPFNKDFKRKKHVNMLWGLYQYRPLSLLPQTLVVSYMDIFLLLMRKWGVIRWSWFKATSEVSTNETSFSCFLARFFSVS